MTQSHGKSQNIRLGKYFIFLLLNLHSWHGLASPFDLNYSGRLVDDQGKPITRGLNISVKFFDAALNGQQKISPLNFLGVVPNAAGLFQLSLNIPSSDRSPLLGYGETYIELTDLDSGKVYPRQRLMAVPYALRVPIDEQTLQYDGQGNLKVSDSGKIQGRDVSTTAPTAGQVLKWDGSKWAPADASGAVDQSNWNTAYSERNQWDGSAGGLNASTARISLGLGTLATKSAVTTTEITDGTISNADIGTNAAIASTKISFTNDSLSGDIIHGGIISNFTSTGIKDLANTTAVTLASSGNVGIGNTTPTSALTITGAARNSAAIANATATIDFSTGNLQYTTDSCGAFVLHNLKDGGSYTLSIKGTVAETCSFTAYSDAGTTVLSTHMPPDHTATTADKHTLYMFLVVGTDVYISWTPGY